MVRPQQQGAIYVSRPRSWWQNLAARLGLSAAPRTRTRAQSGGLAYEGATAGRRARGWNAPTVGPNSGVLGNLHSLRDRSRAAVRNDGYARSAIDRLVTNIVGIGIKPLSKAPDPEFRRRLHALWLRWTDFSDADGRLDFYGQQAQAVRTWLEGGEGFGRLRPRLLEDNLPVPLQIQIIEPELCPHTYNTMNGVNRIRAGIEFTPIGKRAAYWMYRSRPGELMEMDTSKLLRVPADGVMHFYDPLRPGQLRGIPHLTQALVRMFELDQFDDATLIRQKLANLFAGFVTMPGATGQEVDPFAGRDIEKEGDNALVSLEPGLFQELAPGQDVTFNEPPDAGNTYEAFMRQQMLGVAAAVDVPYEVLVGDLSKVNDRTVRVILNEFRRRIMQRQHHLIVYQFCRPIWEEWFNQAWISGLLEVPEGYVDDPAAYRAVEWLPQRWPYLHPVQDVQAERDEIRAGFASRSQKVSERGDDIEELDRQIAEDNRRADALGLKFDSDGRTANRSSTQPHKPDPDRPDDEDERNEQDRK